MRLTVHVDSFDNVDPSAYAILWLDAGTRRWSREGHFGLDLPEWGTWTVEQDGTLIRSPHDTRSLCVLDGLDMNRPGGPFEGEPARRAGPATKRGNISRGVGTCSASIRKPLPRSTACSQTTVLNDPDALFRLRLTYIKAVSTQTADSRLTDATHRFTHRLQNACGPTSRGWILRQRTGQYVGPTRALSHATCAHRAVFSRLWRGDHAYHRISSPRGAAARRSPDCSPDDRQHGRLARAGSGSRRRSPGLLGPARPEHLTWSRPFTTILNDTDAPFTAGSKTAN